MIGSSIALSRRSSPWVALSLIVAAQFMVVLDLSIVNVALATIKTDLGFSEAGLQWVAVAASDRHAHGVEHEGHDPPRGLDLDPGHVADIGVVDLALVSHTVIGNLHEGTKPGRDPPGIIQ